MTAISNRVSLAAPFRVGRARLESCLILRILNEDSKCSELRVALSVKHTLQKKVSCLQVSLYIQPGQIRRGQWYWSGFNPDLHAHVHLVPSARLHPGWNFGSTLTKVDFRIFEKSQLPVYLPVDDLNEQNATEIGYSSWMHMHRDEKLISVAFYSFKSFTEWFTGSWDFSNIVKSTVE